MRNSNDIFFDNENGVYQVRTKEEMVVIKFSDKEKEKIFNEIIDLYDKDNFYSYSEIISQLCENHNGDKIMDVVKELMECSLLNQENFGSEKFSTDAEFETSIFGNENYSTMENKSVGYIGEKEMGRKLEVVAKTLNCPSFEILDATDGLKKNKIKQLITGCDFFIANKSLWSPYHMDFINQAALEFNKPWLLIEGMLGGEGNFSIGPIFHGKETGCYDCYSSRIRSNDEFSSYTQSYEDYLRDNKKFSKPVKVPHLIKQYMAPIIILDISKYLAEWFVPETWRTVLFINTTSYDVTKHDFLKAPFCSTCKPDLDYNQSPWFESVTLE